MIKGVIYSHLINELMCQAGWSKHGPAVRNKVRVNKTVAALQGLVRLFDVLTINYAACFSTLAPGSAGNSIALQQGVLQTGCR